MISIMENYQQQDGSLVIPKAVRPYMRGRERIAPGEFAL
jgi:seryl-tRNA synthetase